MWNKYIRPVWNKYILRPVRLIIGVFKPTWIRRRLLQAPTKGETVRETVTLAFRVHTWNPRFLSVVCLLMFVALLFTIWQAAERFWPRSPAPQSLLQPPPFPLVSSASFGSARSRPGREADP